MFSGCSTLAELNRRRKELVSSGKPVMEVNAAYNRARRELMAAAPSVRRIPSCPIVLKKPERYCAFPLIDKIHGNSKIVITDAGVII